MLAPNAFVRNRYLVVRQVGSGASGGVYEALDMSSRAHVALKQTLVEAAAPAMGGGLSGPEFDRVARQLAALQHPALPKSIDHFAEGDSEFLVADFVPGDDLAVMLERSGGRFPAPQVLRWADQLLDALAFLHGEGLAHGDIKPQNVKLTPRGQPMLLDFGVARVRAPLMKQLGGKQVSSFLFMPPEQIAGQLTSPRGDLYALAATLYYLLIGEPAPLAGSRVNALNRGQPDPLKMPHLLNPQVTTQVSAALVLALALDPAQRFESASVMRATLQRAGASVSAGATVPRPDIPVLPPTNVSQPAAAAATPVTPLTPAVPAAPAAPAPNSTAPVRSSPAAPRWLLPAAIGAIGVVALLALLLFLRRGGSGGAAATPTRVPTDVGATAPAAQPAPTGAPAAPTKIAQEVLAPQATRPAGPGLPPPSAPTAPPTARVAGVEPQSIFVGAPPLRLTLRGANLDGVRAARLVTEGHQPLAAAISAGGPDTLTLDVAPPDEPLNGGVDYRLELDGQVLAAPTITLRDFVERKLVQGVLPQYEYTGRVATDATGAYTGMRAEPNAASSAVGRLRNGDSLDVLQADQDGWYRVRVQASADQAQVGLAGWIERWLVDNQNPPAAPSPTPTPQVPVFVGRVYSAPTDGAVQCGTAFDSSIYGSVENSAGRGIAGARLRVTSADGKNVYNVTTGRGGVYSVPGLGCTKWTVRLVSIPGAPNGVQANRVTVTNLNGGRYTSAEVRFKLQT